MLLEAVLVLVAVMAIVLSPFGQETLRSVASDGLTFRHARHLGHVMLAVALLVVAAAALNVR